MRMRGSSNYVEQMFLFVYLLQQNCNFFNIRMLFASQNQLIKGDVFVFLVKTAESQKISPDELFLKMQEYLALSFKHKA